MARPDPHEATLDLSGAYKAAFDAALRYAAQIADPFGVIRTANQALDEVSQTHTKRHPRTTAAAKPVPLYRVRKLLLMASELITGDNRTKLLGLTRCWRPPRRSPRRLATPTKLLRSIYDIDDPATAVEFTTQLAEDLQDPDLAPELNRLGRTLSR